jgi:hypothetical protein
MSSSKPLGIVSAPVGSTYYMSTDACGTIVVNFAEDSLGYDAGLSLVSAISKSGGTEPLTAHEEYAIEGLWHETLHNKSANTAVIPSIRGQAHDRMIIEAVNQLVARHTYASFMQELLGISAIHTEWVLTNGYGYDIYVTNLRSILELLSYEEPFIKNAYAELMTGYQDFTNRISTILASKCGKYYAGDIIELLEFIGSPKFPALLAVLPRYESLQLPGE